MTQLDATLILKFSKTDTFIRFRIYGHSLQLNFQLHNLTWRYLLRLTVHERGVLWMHRFRSVDFTVQSSQDACRVAVYYQVDII